MKKPMKKPVLKIAALAAAGLAAAGAAAVVLVKKRRAKTAEPAQEAPAHDCYERAEQAEQVTQDVYAAVRAAYNDDGPNANPVYSPKVETPRTADGKIDVTKLASPEDFYNWEEHGCQS